MVNQKFVKLGRVRSVIRELFEYGNVRKAQIGADKVFDFSLGNPNVPPPARFNEVLSDLIANSDPVALHGYTSAPGAYNVRRAVADYINSNFGNHVTPENIYMTCGAAAALCITLCALCNPGDEVVTFVPFFPEYSVFASQAGATLIPVKTEESSFKIDLAALEGALTPATKAVIINSPNNPSGVIYSEESIKALCKLLEEHSKKTGSPVYLISDEPYRFLRSQNRSPYQASA